MLQVDYSDGTRDEVQVAERLREPAVFVLELEVNEEGDIKYNDPLESFVTVPLSTYDNGITSLQDIIKVQYYHYTHYTLYSR
jgi:hypothetical protein